MQPQKNKYAFILDAAALLSMRGGMEPKIKEEPLDEIKTEADEDEQMVLGPAAFGLHPVGNPPPVRTPTEPAVVLNNRGMVCTTYIYCMCCCAGLIYYGGLLSVHL